MNIYFFRGISATGKTTLSNIISRRTNIPVLRKDDIFDALSGHITDRTLLNRASYDILAHQIQTSIDNGADIIIDVALPDKNDLKKFLDKIDFKGAAIRKYFCVCSDDMIWASRVEERLQNPQPNQYFRSVKEIMEHYERLSIAAEPDEIVLDSVLSLQYLIGKII